MGSGAIKLCGVAVVAALSSFILKKSKSDVSFAPCLALSLLVFSFCVGVIEPVINEIDALLVLFDASEYFLPIIKSLVSVVAQIVP